MAAQFRLELRRHCHDTYENTRTPQLNTRL